MRKVLFIYGSLWEIPFLSLMEISMDKVLFIYEKKGLMRETSFLFMEIYERKVYLMEISINRECLSWISINKKVSQNLWERPFYLWKFMRESILINFHGNLWESLFYLWKIYERDIFIHGNLWRDSPFYL